MKFLNLIDFSFKGPAIFEKKEQNLLTIDFLLVVHLALMVNDRAGGFLVLVGKIVLIRNRNFCMLYNVCCIVSSSFVHIPISVPFRL